MADEARRRLGGPAFGLLLVTGITGVALVPLYRVEAPAESLEAIAHGVPFGWLLRAGHAYAAWGLLIVGLLHVVDVVIRRREGRVSVAAWWRWTLLLPATVLALLGGFVMRGDAEARAALAVWRGVMDAVPGVGPLISAFLLGSTGGSAGAGADLGVVALHHVATFTLLLFLLTADHVRRPWPAARDVLAAAIPTLLAAALIPLPLGPPPDAPGSLGSSPLTGPWYLLGLQGMLLDLPPLTAVVVPVGGLLAVGACRWPRLRRAGLATLAVLLAALAAWTVRLLVAP